MRAKIILRAALGLSATAALSALVSVLIPFGTDPLARLVAASLAAFAGFGAVIALVRANRGGGAGLSALAALVEAADNPRLVTDHLGTVIELNSQARDWIGQASPLDFLEAHVDRDTAGEALVRLRQIGRAHV